MGPLHKALGNVCPLLSSLNPCLPSLQARCIIETNVTVTLMNIVTINGRCEIHGELWWGHAANFAGSLQVQCAAYSSVCVRHAAACSTLATPESGCQWCHHRLVLKQLMARRPTCLPLILIDTNQQVWRRPQS